MNTARLHAPGIVLAAVVAGVSFYLAPLLKNATGGRLSLPDMVIALIIGIGLHRFAMLPVFQPGLTWCVKKLLRYAIALLGLRIALGDLVALGWAALLLVVVAMALTLATAILLARMLGRSDGYGALAGAANAVCGASATLAAATVVPDYRNKSADIAFTVVMANAVSTLVMLLYPPLCLALGYDVRISGIMLGATIHDMAQVAGAGYAMGEATGNTAIIVKLFRVFLLLPVVLAIGWWFAAQGVEQGKAKVPLPMFAIVFLLLCFVNTAMAAAPDLAAALYFPQIKAILGDMARWALLIAIAALGLGTSVASILRIGWRHVAVFAGATIVLLLIVVGGLAIGV
ncbi:MAG: YeiH family protein [Beijerinckiaceae bacterium]